MSISSLLRAFALPNTIAAREAAQMRDLVSMHPTCARQIEIAHIAAPTGFETARAALVRQAFVGDHHVVREDAAGNVIAQIASDPDAMRDEAPIVVMAHLDTVFAESTLPPLRHEGSRILLPGIGDNSRGLAAMITLGALLRDAQEPASTRRPIELVATVGEEGLGNLRGARQYFDDRSARGAPDPIAVIALDGPGDELIVHHGISSHRARISFGTAGGHPWANADAANAIHAAGRAISSIAQWSAHRESGVSIAVTRMSGGESLTSIPMQAWFEIDVRSLVAERMPALIDTLQHIVSEAARSASITSRSGHVATRIDTLGERPGGAIDKAHPLVQLAMHATRWQDREPRSASASSDANIPLARGIPAISIGAGGLGGGEHTAHEWYDDTNGSRGVARAFALVLTAASRKWHSN